MEHTPTPWYFDGDGVYSNEDCEGAPLAHVLSVGYDNDFRNIDARRIVACVNACAGIPTEKLEGKSIEEYVTEQAFLTGMAPSDDGFGISLNGMACQMLAASFAGQFIGSGAVNFLEVNMVHPEIGPFTVTIQRHQGKTPGQMKAEVEQQLTTERASLFAESQRKQQLEQQVEELVGVLGGLLELHDNPAPFSGKTGEERMRMLENATAKRNAAIFAARAVIQKVRGGE